MKNRQFRVLLFVIIVISIIFYLKLDKIDVYEDIILNNIATVDYHVTQTSDTIF